MDNEMNEAAYAFDRFQNGTLLSKALYVSFEQIF